MTTSPSTGLGRRNGVFNFLNQLTSSQELGGPTTTYAYDLNGNLLTETKQSTGLPAEVTTYAWDRDNRLRSVTPPTGTPTTYSYDANGMRTQRVDWLLGISAISKSKAKDICQICAGSEYKACLDDDVGAAAKSARCQELLNQYGI